MFLYVSELEGVSYFDSSWPPLVGLPQQFPAPLLQERNQMTQLRSALSQELLRAAQKNCTALEEQENVASTGSDPPCLVEINLALKFIKYYLKLPSQLPPNSVTC
jgi:hypothetical protein